MNFGQTFLILFALASSADAQLRGLATSRKSNSFQVGHYNEKLGSCIGAVCGLWGDPHIISCDGLGFDCNVQGLFTLMKNFMYNIQANFVHVNSIEMEKIFVWQDFPAATYTNDIIIQNVENSDVPLMQFSFPHFHNEENIAPSERGCFVNAHYDSYMSGYGKTGVESIDKCRERCEKIDGCTKFVFVYDEYNDGDKKHPASCWVADDSATLQKRPSHYSRSVAGPVNKCGHSDMYDAILDNSDQVAKAKIIGNGTGNENKKSRHGAGCPVLYYENGELKDISDVGGNGSYLYGNSDSKSSVKLYGTNKIKIVHTTASGAKSEIMLETAGDGPGEIWSCHWNMFVCLPKDEKERFVEGGLGLFGSPDGNSQNDWMNPNGNLIQIPTNNPKGHGTKGQESYDYCKNNWCVSQDDSLMAYPENTSYDDVKCLEEEYVDFNIDNDSCVLSTEKIRDACKDSPPLLVHTCQTDCCYGGCPLFFETQKEIAEFVTLSTNIEDCVYDNPEIVPDPICDDENNFLGTGESVCPLSSKSAVKVIHKSTTADIPDGQPVIYGLTFSDPSDDDHGREVKFRVDNPFSSKSDIFVRYAKKVGQHANDPACDSLDEVVPGCDVESEEFTVGCIGSDYQDPFAIVDIYFASKDSFVLSNASPDTEVEKCCSAPAYDGFGVIKYSFKIQCVCPDSIDSPV